MCRVNEDESPARLVASINNRRHRLNSFSVQTLDSSQGTSLLWASKYGAYRGCNLAWT